MRAHDPKDDPGKGDPGSDRRLISAKQLKLSAFIKIVPSPLYISFRILVSGHRCHDFRIIAVVSAWELDSDAGRWKFRNLDRLTVTTYRAKTTSFRNAMAFAAACRSQCLLTASSLSVFNIDR